MTFALNPTSEQSEALFQQAAINQNGTSAPIHKSTTHHGLSTGAKVGIALGVCIPVIILAILAFFFFQRRRGAKRNPADNRPVEEYYAVDQKPPSENMNEVDVKDNAPQVPPKGSEVHGDSMTSELPGYAPVELPTNRYSAQPQWQPQSPEEDFSSPISPSVGGSPRRKPVGSYDA